MWFVIGIIMGIIIGIMTTSMLTIGKISDLESKIIMLKIKLREKKNDISW